MVSTSGVLAALITNFVIATVLFSLFCVVRRRFPWIYSPRMVASKPFHYRPNPPEPPRSLYSWLWFVYKIDDTTLISTCGVDAAIFVKFFSVCVRMFSLMLIPGIGIILPLNYTAKNQVAGFESMSMSNVETRSDRLYAHFLVAWFCSLVSYYYLHEMWLFYQSIRAEFLIAEALKNRRLSVLVQNIPTEYSNDSALFKVFQYWFPSHIVNAYMARDTELLKKFIDEREEIIHKLERCNVIFAESGERPKVFTNVICCDRADGIDYWQSEIRRLNELIEKEFRANRGLLRSGFVTFDSTVAVSLACRVEKDNIPNSMKCQLAPEPSDVYWPNLSLNPDLKRVRAILVETAMFFLVAFWVIPVTFVQSFTNLQSLAQKLPFLEPVLHWDPVITGIIEGFLPALVLLVFNIVLPIILLQMAKFKGLRSYSTLQASVLNRFFVFQLFNNFLVTVIAGSVFSSIQNLINDPSGIINTLGVSIPLTSTFFVTLTLFTALSVFPLLLLRADSLIVGLLMKKFFIKTQWELSEIEKSPEADYGKLWPQHLFIFIIAINYCVIAPLVIPFAVVFFSIGYIVSKYQLLYVFQPKFEAGGSFWPIVFNKMIAAIVLGQIVLIGVMGIKQVPIPTALLLPLPFITLYFRRQMYRSYYFKTEILPLNTAVEADMKLKQLGIGELGAKSALLNHNNNNNIKSYRTYENNEDENDDIEKNNNSGGAAAGTIASLNLIHEEEPQAAAAAGAEDESLSPKEQKSSIELDKRKEVEIINETRPSLSQQLDWNPLARNTSEPATPKIAIGAIPHQLLKEMRGNAPKPELFIQTELQAKPSIDPKSVGTPRIKAGERQAIPDRV